MNPALLTLIVITVLSVLIAAAIAVLIIALQKSGNAKIGAGSQWGLDLSSDFTCPNCGNKLPALRKPKTLKQALWGGWTCENCGIELDKWQKPLK